MSRVSPSKIGSCCPIKQDFLSKQLLSMHLGSCLRIIWSFKFNVTTTAEFTCVAVSHPPSCLYSVWCKEFCNVIVSRLCHNSTYEEFPTLWERGWSKLSCGV